MLWRTRWQMGGGADCTPINGLVGAQRSRMRRDGGRLHALRFRPGSSRRSSRRRFGAVELRRSLAGRGTYTTSRQSVGWLAEVLVEEVHSVLEGLCRALRMVVEGISLP